MSVYPYFGAVPGLGSESDEFGAGSYNCDISNPLRLAYDGTAKTNIAESIESDIWTYNPLTQEIPAVWVNPGGESVTVELAYANDGNVCLGLIRKL